MASVLEPVFLLAVGSTALAGVVSMCNTLSHIAMASVTCDEAAPGYWQLPLCYGSALQHGVRHC